MLCKATTKHAYQSCPPIHTFFLFLALTSSAGEEGAEVWGDSVLGAGVKEWVVVAAEHVQAACRMMPHDPECRMMRTRAP